MINFTNINFVYKQSSLLDKNLSEAEEEKIKKRKKQTNKQKLQIVQSIYNYYCDVNSDEYIIQKKNREKIIVFMIIK